MPTASEQQALDSEWLKQYRARQQARNGASYINGVPAQQALGMTPDQVVAANPVLPAPGVPAVTPLQADRAMATAEQIGADRFAAQQAEKIASRDRYNAFLADQGIDSTRIGNSRLTGSVGDRTLETPSLAQQQSAVNQANLNNSIEGNARIAARRAYQRGDLLTWAGLANTVKERQSEMGNNRSSEDARQFWLDRLLGAYNYRNNLMSRANGFANW